MINHNDIVLLLNIHGIDENLINDAISDGKEYLDRFLICERFSNNVSYDKAWKYLSAYYLLPKISQISGNQGMFKSIGFGDNSQKMIEDEDIRKRQKWYFLEARNIIQQLNEDQFPFGIDI